MNMEQSKNLSDQKCLACGAGICRASKLTARNFLKTKHTYTSFFKCIDCGSLNSETIDRSQLYNDRDSSNYASGTHKIILFLKSNLLNMSYKRFFKDPHRESPTVLDFGCGGGELSNALSSNGVSVVACDLQTSRPTSLHENIQYFPLSDVDFSLIDLVIARHVWEHLDEPREVLSSLKEKLPNGARIVLEVPNANSVFRNLLSSRWPGYFAPYHTIIFTKTGMAVMAKDSGFHIVRQGAMEAPIFGSFILQLGAPRNLSRFFGAIGYPFQYIFSKFLGSSESIYIELEVKK